MKRTAVGPKGQQKQHGSLLAALNQAAGSPGRPGSQPQPKRPRAA
jgi:hypothetical protein